MDKQRAWIYLILDAPEDKRGIFFSQEGKLRHYAKDKGMTVVGVATDLSKGPEDNLPGWARTTQAGIDFAFDVLLMRFLGNQKPRKGAGPLLVTHYYSADTSPSEVGLLPKPSSPQSDTCMSE